MITVTLANMKGGCAKTTTASALAAGLHNRGKRVLAVDLDPQSNLCFGLGVDMLNASRTLHAVFKGDTDAEAAIYQYRIGFDVMPGGMMLAAADLEFNQTGREYMVREALNRVSDNYDFCVIDTGPSLGILVVNALVASDLVVIPITADSYAVQGLTQLYGQIQNVKRYCNPGLKVAGLLLTRNNPRQSITRIMLKSIEEKAQDIGSKVFDTQIRESVAVREAALLRGDIFCEAPRANATVDYGAFVDEFLQGVES